MFVQEALVAGNEEEQQAMSNARKATLALSQKIQVARSTRASPTEATFLVRAQLRRMTPSIAIRKNTFANPKAQRVGVNSGDRWGSRTSRTVTKRKSETTYMHAAMAAN
jgi:hypothetical protein